MAFSPCSTVCAWRGSATRPDRITQHSFYGPSSFRPWLTNAGSGAGRVELQAGEDHDQFRHYSRDSRLIVGAPWPLSVLKNPFIEVTLDALKSSGGMFDVLREKTQLRSRALQINKGGPSDQRLTTASRLADRPPVEQLRQHRPRQGAHSNNLPLHVAAPPARTKTEISCL